MEDNKEEENLFPINLMVLKEPIEQDGILKPEGLWANYLALRTTKSSLLSVIPLSSVVRISRRTGKP